PAAGARAAGTPRRREASAGGRPRGAGAALGSPDGVGHPPGRTVAFGRGPRPGGIGPAGAGDAGAGQPGPRPSPPGPRHPGTDSLPRWGASRHRSAPCRPAAGRPADRLGGPEAALAGPAAGQKLLTIRTGPAALLPPESVRPIADGRVRS